MRAVVSSLFRVLHFHHQGKIITVNQFSFFPSSYSDGNVPFVEHTSVPYESVGVGLFKDPALMGVFSLLPPSITPINMISIRFDPWVLLPVDQVESWGDDMPLSPAELNYVDIISASDLSSEPAPSSKDLYAYVQCPWLGNGTSSDPLQEMFPSDEAIIETMSF